MNVIVSEHSLNHLIEVASKVASGDTSDEWVEILKRKIKALKVEQKKLKMQDNEVVTNYCSGCRSYGNACSCI